MRQLLSAATTLADPVLNWNALALAAIRDTRATPPAASRALAIAQVAVLHAVEATRRSDTMARAAVDSAAFVSLTSLFPSESTALDAAYSASIASLPAGRASNLGIVAGVSAAEAEIAAREGDGSSSTTPYTPSTAIGLWRPTAPAFAPALLPGWGGVRPFGLSSGSEYRPGPPPAVGSPAYITSLAITDLFGSATSTTRTADQTEVALFWNDAAGTSTPPGHWNEIAATSARSRPLGLLGEARMFATLDVAMADAAIAAWDVKYADNSWRPITAIRRADSVEATSALKDPSWTPLIATPPFPSYVSGHSVFSAAAATVLSAYFGPNTTFDATSDGLPGVTRHYSSFAQAASEAGMSRIYGGIHYPFDNAAGLELGWQVGLHDLGHVTTYLR